MSEIFFDCFGLEHPVYFVTYARIVRDSSHENINKFNSECKQVWCHAMRVCVQTK